MDKCTSVVDIATKLWKAFGGLAPPAVAAIEKSAEEMIKFYNSVVGNSPLHIGPRPLPTGQTLTGTIESVGDRTFIGTVPTRSPAKLTITKTGGKDNVTIHVCAVDVGGHHTELKTFQATAATPDGHVFEVDVPAQRIALAVLDGTKLIGAMSYKILLTDA